MKRTTIELDERLVDRARLALGTSTMRATVEEALRRAAESGEGEGDKRADRQREYFRSLPDRIDLAVLKSDEMWR
jgi:Arc/MetJ family transcription regulator